MYNKEITILNGLKTGYLVFRDHQHPLAYEDGSVYLHRHLVSINLGRWLTSDEHVHHIDGNKLNNKISNLETLSNKEHGLIHNPSKTIPCNFCGNLFISTNSKSKYCSQNCFKQFSIKNKLVTKEILDELIPNTTWKALGEMFGYSDSGIRKRAKALGCLIPIRNRRN